MLAPGRNLPIDPLIPTTAMEKNRLNRNSGRSQSIHVRLKGALSRR